MKVVSNLKNFLSQKIPFLILYLLTYTTIYYIVANIDDDAHFSVRGKEIKLQKLSYWECFYFSIITQTTIGYGEIVPVSFWGQLAVSIQALGTIIIVLYHITL